MSEKKENREEEKEQSSSRSGLTDEQIEAALNVCIFGQTKETRYKDCPLDSDKEPCITNLHLAALEYIGRLKYRAEKAEMALDKACYYLSLGMSCWNMFHSHFCPEDSKGLSCVDCRKKWLIKQAKKVLAEEQGDGKKKI